MKLPAMPVRSGRDATLNFDRLQRAETEREQSVAIATRTAAQKIPSGVFTIVKLDTAINDAYSQFDLTKGWYVVPFDGYYHVDGNVLVKGPGAAWEGNAVLKIYVGGIARVSGPFMEKQGKEFDGFNVSGVVHCLKGEHIEMLLFQASGTERETFNSPEFNQLAVYKVA